MRNIDECMAEISRRSAAVFKERKQRRRHILMACIPLALCVAIFSAFILPAMMPGDAASEAIGVPEAFGAGGSMNENLSESLTRPISRIEVSGTGVSLTYTEPAEIQLITDQLHSYTVRDPELTYGNADVVDKDNGVKPEISGSVADPASTGYIVTLVMREGGSTEYYLAGNTLKNRTTNQTYALSQKQVDELKALLGISHR